MSDATEAFCSCEQFDLWYSERGDIGDVCRCGHRFADHVNGVGLCVGDVTIYPPEVKP